MQGIAMHDPYQQIELLGVEEARRLAQSKHERTQIDIAFSLLSDDAGELGITHSGFALTSLPHKKTDRTIWMKPGYRLTLHVESGRQRDGAHIGIPYGATARLILLYLQTEALRTQSRRIELGSSMRNWMTRMGMQVGGKSYKLITEQSRRISACRLTFFYDMGESEADARLNSGFVTSMLPVQQMRDSEQLSIWQDTVELDETFFNSLQKHAVPLRDEAIRQLSSRSLALDIYIWLAYRLHVLNKPTRVTWPALKEQFGQDYARMVDFRRWFRDAFGYALAAYPDARAEEIDVGLELRPSPPPVLRRQIGWV